MTGGDAQIAQAPGLEPARWRRLLAECAKRAKTGDPRQDLVSHARQAGGNLQAPVWLTLQLTSECNQHCRFCFQSPPRKPAAFHSQAQVDSLCRQLAALGVDTVTLTGGEPTCHPEFLAVVASIKAYGLRLKISTNGINLTEDIIPRLAPLLEPVGDEIILSFDAARRETYRNLRGADDYPALMRTLEQLALHQVPFATHTLILKANLQEIEEITTRALGYGARECLVGPPYPKPRIPADTYANALEILETYERLLLGKDTDPITLNPWNLGHLGQAAGDAAEVPAGSSCPAGYASCAIDAQGNVGLCEQALDLGAAVGNLQAVPFPALWRQTRDWLHRHSPAGPGLAPACPAKALGADLTVNS
jgi:mycofactocin biosynthetic radical S-adenosylmethionine protein MftC